RIAPAMLSPAAAPPRWCPPQARPRPWPAPRHADLRQAAGRQSFAGNVSWVLRGGRVALLTRASRLIAGVAVLLDRQGIDGAIGWRGGLDWRSLDRRGNAGAAAHIGNPASDRLLFTGDCAVVLEGIDGPGRI